MLMDREQLEVLKRQIEQEYELDMAAIERLQQRFHIGLGTPSTGVSAASTGKSASTAKNSGSTGISGGSISKAAAAPAPVYMTPATDKSPKMQAHASELPGLEPRPVPQPDELTGTLRAIFSAQSRTAAAHR